MEEEKEQNSPEQEKVEETPKVEPTEAALEEVKEDPLEETREMEPKAERKGSPWLKLRKHKIVKYGFLALTILVCLFLFTDKIDFLKSTGMATSDFGSVDVEFYVMSQCPYGTQVEDAIYPLLTKFGSAINLKVDFIATDKGDGTFDSRHGQPEVDENIRQLCAMKLSPDAYMDFIFCQNKGIMSAETNWESCATTAGIDTAALKACAEGDEGKQLHSESVARAGAVGARGSPTIFIAGQPYAGGSDAAAFQMEICKRLQGHPECANMPECTSHLDCNAEPEKVGECIANKCLYTDAVQFDVFVVNDETCGPECDAAGLIMTTQQLFKGAKIILVDISSQQGQQLVEDLDLKFVPSLIFDSKVKETKAWVENVGIGAAFDDMGGWLKLLDEASGSTRWIDEEARLAEEAAQAARLEELGIDLKDGTPQIDFFVMSYCPYGNQAEEGIAPVYEILKDDAEFNPRYVWYSNYQGGGPGYCLDKDSIYCSMHGIQEANQNVRELCVARDFGMDEWFDFARAVNINPDCNNLRYTLQSQGATEKEIKEAINSCFETKSKEMSLDVNIVKDCALDNIDTCWQAVAEDLDLDVDKISDCEENDWLDLVEPDKELGDMLGVGRSPQVFIEMSAYQGTRAAADYQAALCAAFEDAPDACNIILESAGTPSAPADNC